MKKKLSIAVACCLVLSFPAVASAEVQSVVVVGGDNSFLGEVIDDKYDNQSICNPYGNYGSKYSESIFNPYGTHGGTYSEIGSYNPRSTNPPRVVAVEDGRSRIIAYVTKNPKFRVRIDPDLMKSVVCKR